MGDGSAGRDSWAEYLRSQVDRPKWSVARLARESGIHRATIFKWISGKGGVTVTSVRAIAAALGDNPEVALRAAAGNLVGAGDQEDPDIAEILASGLPDAIQQELIEHVIQQRARDAERRRDDVRRLIRLARGRPA